MPGAYARLWDALVSIGARTFRPTVVLAAGFNRWRPFMCAAVAGIALAFGGARLAHWVGSPMFEAQGAVDLSTALSPQQRYLGDLVRQCAPRVAANTMLAIMRTESGFNSLALHVNADLRLQRAPRTTAEAIGWSGWLISRGYSVDLGLMQINSRNLTRLKMSVADAFEPCRNIHAAATILREQYVLAAQVHGDPRAALLAAISAYNTGNFRGGFRNGYVSKVLTNARPH
jgi:type IV secretion system protein VirB1